jgi:methionine synthase I (cobalamin-dependent)
VSPESPEPELFKPPVGPSINLLTFAPRHTFEEHVAAFAEQIHNLWSANVEAIHLAFHLDSKNLPVALRGIVAVQDDLGCRVPIMITLDLTGTIASGERPEALWEVLREYEPIASRPCYVRLWK